MTGYWVSVLVWVVCLGNLHYTMGYLVLVVFLISSHRSCFLGMESCATLKFIPLSLESDKEM
jgi:hypothetical protein